MHISHFMVWKRLVCYDLFNEVVLSILVVTIALSSSCWRHDSISSSEYRHESVSLGLLYAVKAPSLSTCSGVACVDAVIRLLQRK